MNIIRVVAASDVPNIASISSIGKGSWIYEVSLNIESAREVNTSLFCLDMFIIFCKLICEI